MDEAGIGLLPKRGELLHGCCRDRCLKGRLPRLPTSRRETLQEKLRQQAERISSAEPWLRNRKSAQVHICMEATGAYWFGLAQAMHDNGKIVSVVNPSRTTLPALSQLRRTKTDAVDAEMLAEFCRTQRPGAWQPPRRKSSNYARF
jgi:transposase